MDLLGAQMNQESLEAIGLIPASRQVEPISENEVEPKPKNEATGWTRLSLLRSGAKLLCCDPACNSQLRAVVDYFPSAKHPVKLSCGHRRESYAGEAA
jgi:hypothetical protein